MPDHERDGRALLLGERKEMICQIAADIAVKNYIVRSPETIEDQEQQQWIVGRLSESFSLFDQELRPFHSRLSFWCPIPFDMHERIYERDLNPNLLATQRGSGGQSRNLVERTGEPGYRFSSTGPAMPLRSCAPRSSSSNRLPTS